MTQSLLSVGDLLSQSWNQYVKFWKENAKIAAWLIIPMFLSDYFVISSTAALTSGRTIGAGMSGIFGLSILISLAEAIIGIPIAQQILKQDGGKNAQAKWTDAIVPYFIVAILTGILIGVGFVLLVLPGIWLSVALGYSVLYVLEDGKTGTDALKASYNLVKGRWWSVFFLVFVTGLAYGIAMVIVQGVVRGVFGMGGAYVAAIAGDAVTALVTPLFIIVGVKVFHNLKSLGPVAASKPATTA